MAARTARGDECAGAEPVPVGPAVGNLTESNVCDLVLMACEHEFHAARGRVVNAFAHLESVICAIAKRSKFDLGCPTGPFSHKLDAIRAIKVGPALSKASKAALDEAMIEIQSLLAVRNDVVHAPLSLIDPGEPTALYINGAQQLMDFPLARPMTLRQHIALVERVEAITRRLTPNPPAQPRPSLPAAAGP